LYPAESPVKKAALCAGSGSSILKGMEADLYLTGKRLCCCFIMFIEIVTRGKKKKGKKRVDWLLKDLARKNYVL